MNIYVLLKRTFDTEEKIMISGGNIQDEGVEYIINPYDEYAVEEAIVLRDAHGGKVTVITVGDEEANNQLRTALAMGADEAVLISDEDIENGDAYSTAKIIAKYLEDKNPSIILAGNLSTDGGSGQVGPLVAELLNINAVTTITRLEISENNATIERDVEGDLEKVEVSLPLLVTCQQGLNEPRYPSLPGIMKAKKKPIESIELDDLDLDLDEDGVEAPTLSVEIFLPEAKQAGKILSGEINDQVQELVTLINSKVKVM